MKEYASLLAGPVCWLILLCGMAIFLGTNPWRVASAVMICLPIDGYVVFSMFTVLWAINIGNVDVHQKRTLKGRFYYWRGLAVVLTIVLAASGSFIMLFASAVRGLTSGAA